MPEIQDHPFLIIIFPHVRSQKQTCTYQSIPTFLNILIIIKYYICSPFIENCLASPKSIKNIYPILSTNPVKKFSGLISLCIRLFECTNSILYKHCKPILRTVFKENLLSHASK